MFVRTVRAAGAKGEKHEYVRLVESYRDGSKTKQRVVLSLGRKDILAAHLDALNRVLSGKSEASAEDDADEAVEALDAWDWGPQLVARALWDELHIPKVIEQHRGGRGRADRVMLAERALVLVANRLCAPASEHGLASWLETDFVCDRCGRRWVPAWRDDTARKASRLPRVRLELRQLQQWYRTLDQLHACKQEIEKELFVRLRDLFALSPDMVFYDLTSTYFEGQGPEMAAHGYSRDGKPRNRQVLVGVVMVNGWPIAHHVFRGNLRDEKTISTVVEEIEKRFGLKRVVFVGDRGMMAKEARAFLKAQRETGGQHGYLLGMPRRRHEHVVRYIERATGPWTECPAGIAAREKATPPKTLVQEVASDEPGVRVFVVRSDERLDYERGMRNKVMERTREALVGLEKRVQSGKLKSPEKIGAAAARILGRHHGHRYYGWELKDGAFRFFESDNLAREKAYEGTYLIQTEETGISAVEAVQAYKELSEVERGFRVLKDVIEMRPIFHQTDTRVEAHIFVAALALLLHRGIEKKLKAAGSDLSATEALKALRTVRVVDIDLGNGKHKRSVTRGSRHAAQVLAALGITERQPPTPPEGAQTLM